MICAQVKKSSGLCKLNFLIDWFAYPINKFSYHPIPDFCVCIPRLHIFHQGQWQFLYLIPICFAISDAKFTQYPSYLSLLPSNISWFFLYITYGDSYNERSRTVKEKLWNIKNLCNFHFHNLTNGFVWQEIDNKTDEYITMLRSILSCFIDFVFILKIESLK